MARVGFGKYYRTESGEKIGPMLRYWGGRGSLFLNGDDLNDTRIWDSSGSCGIEEHAVVAEWGCPVITETVKRIVPGVYGPVNIFENDGLLEIYVSIMRADDKDKIDEAIAHLTAIRDAGTEDGK